jgi:PST family polysaccharide transporter
LVLFALFFVENNIRRTALICITLIGVGSQLTRTPRLILTRRVAHRRLTVVQTIDFFTSSILCVLLAWGGATIEALIVSDLITFLANWIGFYIWRPVWRPHLKWDTRTIRYFLGFGGRTALAEAIQRSLDKLDDLWVGTYLGDAAVGFYSRAYTFATYPRKILVAPISAVVTGTYAELKHDRQRLSQASFRTSALLVRSGFLLTGLLALIAPELIHLLLGNGFPCWMPFG